DAVALTGRNSHLGADPDIGSEALHDAAEIALGFAVPVHRRGVEIVDAQLDRPRHGPLLVARAAAYHQPADRPAAEPEHRPLEPGPAERACFHRFLPFVGRGSKPSRPGLSISRAEIASIREEEGVFGSPSSSPTRHYRRPPNEIRAPLGVRLNLIESECKMAPSGGEKGVHSLFRGVAVIPVLTIEREADAVPLARALHGGGLPLLEVTLRTPAALAAIAAIVREVPQVLVGAGTVQRPADVVQA